MAFLESFQGPWVCIGDFNFTTDDSETLGGRRSSSSFTTNYLNGLIFEFGAINLGYSRNAFTWARGR